MTRKVACVGDSITYGETIADREVHCYPAQLQRLLGDKSSVKNFGVSGTTLLGRLPISYTNTQAYRDALAFAADIDIICLGGNDLLPGLYNENKDKFVPDYLALIESFRLVRPDALIVVGLLPPLRVKLSGYESEIAEWYSEITSLTIDAALEAHAEIVDFNEPFIGHPEYQPDGVHPNKTGAKIIAETVRDFIVRL